MTTKITKKKSKNTKKNIFQKGPVKIFWKLVKLLIYMYSLRENFKKLGYVNARLQGVWGRCAWFVFHLNKFFMFSINITHDGVRCAFEEKVWNENKCKCLPCCTLRNNHSSHQIPKNLNVGILKIHDFIFVKKVLLVEFV